MIGAPGGIGGGGVERLAGRLAAIRGRLDSLHVPQMPPAPGSASARAPASTPGSSAPPPVDRATLGRQVAHGEATIGEATAGAQRGATSHGSAAVLPPAAGPWLDDIAAAARRAGIEPSLLTAVVRHESNFRADAVSPAGAVGLAQLMPATARGLGVDPADPRQNLDGGARYLRAQLDRFGSVELALAAYNAGPTRVAQAGGVPRIPETLAYVERVMQTWEQLR